MARGVLLALALFAFLPQFALAQTPTNAGVEAKVREAFATVPNMVVVAKCESGFRQFGPDGNVLQGGADNGYIGIFQISERVHAARALELGHDIMTVDGNIGYARVLYAASGLAPWKACAPEQAASGSSEGGGRLPGEYARRYAAP